MSKKQHPADVFMEEIDAWGRWFLSAHAERLQAAGLTPAEHARELAAVQASAAAIVERMRAECAARRTAHV